MLLPAAFRRTLTASARTRPTSCQIYRPLFYNPRNIQRLANMATDRDEGVHNIESKKAYLDAVNTHGDLMVIDCFATWCGPCKVISPKVVEFSKEFTDARFYKVDVDQVPDVAQELGIRAMPTFVLFKDGELAETVVGANPAALKAAISKHYVKK